MGKLAGVAQEQVTTQLASQKTRMADKLGVLATALHGAGSQVRDENEAQIADYIEAAAGQIDHVATALREQDVMQLLRSAEDVARRQPELFLAATFALGFAATRFLRSSSPSGGNSWSRSTYGESFDRSSYRATSGDYGSGAYGQGYAGYGASMGSNQGNEAGIGSGYGGQTTTGYASSSGFGAAMGPSSQGQSGIGASSGVNSGSGDTVSGQARNNFGTGPAGSATGWQSGSTIDPGPEGR